MWGVDYKKRMEDILYEDMEQYLKSRGLTQVYGLPALAYADAEDPKFMRLFEEKMTMHPKEIYRPGRTVIISFLPFMPEYVKANFNSDKTVAPAYTFAYENAIIISSHINGVIQRSLEDMGREVSLTNLPGDWNEERFGPEWSHKCAAYVAGMGRFGPAGSFYVEGYGSLGRFNSIMTELPMDTTSTDESPDEMILNIRKQCLFQGDEAQDIPDHIIKRCPAEAIGSRGVDRIRCVEFCRSQGQIVPEPEVCAKCF